jgi:hypothetical protein
MSEQEKGQEPKEPQVDGQESAPAEAPEVSTNEDLATKRHSLKPPSLLP